MSEPTAGDSPAGIVGVFDRAAETYDQVGVTFFGTVARSLVDRTAPRHGERVLDLGCGLGASALSRLAPSGPAGACTPPTSRPGWWPGSAGGPATSRG